MLKTVKLNDTLSCKLDTNARANFHLRNLHSLMGV